MRKLASLQRVTGVRPIEGADKIELVDVLGWQCVVKKDDNIKEGDLIVYIEIDSVCPPVEPFLFLADRKYRVRTIKLRGSISQGLALPVSMFPSLSCKMVEDEDVTEQLGIVKHDPEAARERRSAGRTKVVKLSPIMSFFMQFRWFRNLHRKFFPEGKRGWPEFIRKTDETRIQNYGHILQQHGHRDYYTSEKLDGQSSSYWLTKTKGFLGRTVETFGVCSRNIYLRTKHSCTWWDMADKYNIRAKLQDAYRAWGDICIQGEICGPGVQGNKYGLTELRLFIFNVWSIREQRYLEFDEFTYFCTEYGFETVPILAANMTLEGQTVQDLVASADGKSVLNSKTQREGLVIRTMRNMPNGEPISFKAISNKFLLKHEDDEDEDEVADELVPA